MVCGEGSGRVAVVYDIGSWRAMVCGPGVESRAWCSERAGGGQVWAARVCMHNSGFMAAGGDVDDAGDAGGVIVVAVDDIPPRWSWR